MPNCTRCGNAAAFNELTNYEIPAPREKGAVDSAERLCFMCVRKELYDLRKRVQKFESEKASQRSPITLGESMK